MINMLIRISINYHYYYTGMRVGEFVNFKRKHLNLEENKIIIKQGKGKKDRLTITFKIVTKKLLYYICNTTFRTEYLFETNRYRKYSITTIQEILKKASLSINKHVSPHMTFFCNSLTRTRNRYKNYSKITWTFKARNDCNIHSSI